MDKQKSPKGFIVVLPGEIIEIPQDSDKSWLTLFYSLPPMRGSIPESAAKPMQTPKRAAWNLTLRKDSFLSV